MRPDPTTDVTLSVDPDSGPQTRSPRAPGGTPRTNPTGSSSYRLEVRWVDTEVVGILVDSGRRGLRGPCHRKEMLFARDCLLVVGVIVENPTFRDKTGPLIRTWRSTSSVGDTPSPCSCTTDTTDGWGESEGRTGFWVPVGPSLGPPPLSLPGRKRVIHRRQEPGTRVSRRESLSPRRPPGTMSGLHLRRLPTADSTT